MGKKQKLRCQHDNTYFDRTLCASPCDEMHTSCQDCGYIFGGCYWLSRDAEPNELDNIKVNVTLDGKALEDRTRAELADWEKALIDAISLEPQRIMVKVGDYLLSDEHYGDYANHDYGCNPEYDQMNDYALAEWEKELLKAKLKLDSPHLTTHDDIGNLIDETLGEIHDLNDSKGREYATEADGLANFKNRAKQMGITPLQVWGIFYGKHSDAIFSYLKRGEVLSEPIEGRIDDAILYLILLKALVREAS